jgi:flap endonuclease-1
MPSKAIWTFIKSLLTQENTNTKIEKSKNILKKKSLFFFKNKNLVFDMSLILYRYIIAIRKNGSDLKTSTGKITSHLQAVMTNVLFNLRLTITPLYIFDNFAPSRKKSSKSIIC